MSRVKVIFLLHGESFEPNIVTDAVGIKPVASWKKGDSHSQIKNVIHKECGWEWSTGYEESYNADDQIRKVVDRLLPRVDTFKALIAANKLVPKFEIIVQIVNNECPGMPLEHEILTLAHKLGAVIDIDLFVE